MNFPYDILDIPKACLLDKRVYKKMFYENTDLTVTDKKWFTQDIDLITWVYTLKPDLAMISRFEEEHYAYDEVVVMDVDVNSFDHAERLSDIMHRSIPYPLFIIFREENHIALSVADKRYNRSDDSAATIHKLWATDVFDKHNLSETKQAFLSQLSFDKQPQLHLKAFYHGWLDAFYAYDSSKVTGSFTMLSEQEQKQQRRQALHDYRQLKQEITELKTSLKKEKAFSKKMDLNVEIKALEKQLNQVSKKL